MTVVTYSRLTMASILSAALLVAPAATSVGMAHAQSFEEAQRDATREYGKIMEQEMVEQGGNGSEDAPRSEQSSEPTLKNLLGLAVLGLIYCAASDDCRGAIGSR